jgi:hypothetical protein
MRRFSRTEAAKRAVEREASERVRPVSRPRRKRERGMGDGDAQTGGER